MYILENENLKINKENILKLKEELKDVVIVAATKYISEPAMKDLYDLGITNFGENRVEPFIRKHKNLKDLDITWHFIGHLQRNKCKDIINDIDYLHSLDSIELAKMINKYRTTPLKCFIVLKMIDDSNKNGVSPLGLEDFINNIKSNFKKVEIIGLMAMAEPNMGHEELKDFYKKVVEIGSKYNLKEYSIGMSSDYEEAVKMGSTHVRLGRILYEMESD